MASGEESGESSDPSDIGLAKTRTPVAGVPIVSPGTVPSHDARTDPPFGERPASDEVARAVARTRIANKLFAKEERVKLGRYHLLEMVGSGGMGVVWGAWDPELDRRVAIKLVKATMQAARDRILVEGQSLAKLSHPNVVPVYDVGVVDEQVFIVMEWVRGKNLRAYCKEPRTIREILTVYRAAAEGLCAAHRAGLIHRDFKPDNAMYGDDGRVRVLDFGLARGEVKPDSDSGDGSSDLTRGAGTPKYMPPEQAEGEALTPAVDQYAFCVSLREAITGRNADGKDAIVPRWLAEILARGTANVFSDRYASMDDLIRALARDPATIWRRRIAVGSALGLVGVAFAIGSARGGGDQVELCASSADEIAGSWNDSIRSRLSTHLQSLGPYGESEATRLGSVLDGYRTRWADAHRAACVKQTRGELTQALYERNLTCLGRTRIALDTAIDLLAHADAQGLSSTVGAVSGLPSPELCLVETEGSRVVPPPAHLATSVTLLRNEVERARVLALALNPQAIKVAGDAEAKAEKLGYLPLVARAQLEYGAALRLQDKRLEALGWLSRASKLALRANDFETAIEAYAREIPVLAVEAPSELPDNAKAELGALGHMEELANGLGPSGAFARALLYNSIGLVRMVSDEREQALAAFQTALSIRDSMAKKPAELNIIWGNLAMVTKDPAQRQTFLDRDRSELERDLGPNHPSVLTSRINAAMATANPERSLSQLREPCELLARLHPHLIEKIAQCAFEVGWLLEERGDAAGAAAAMSRVGVYDGPEREIATAYREMLDGKLAEAGARMHRVAAQLGGKDHQVFDRFRAIDAGLVAALSARRDHRDEQAIGALEDALVNVEATKMFGAHPPHQRRAARVHALLALLTSKSRPTAAAKHARSALDWYQTAGGYDALSAELAVIAGPR